MDCEYVLSSMAELGEITPVEYSVAMHHELTHSVSKMHQPQYDNLNKVSTT